MQNEIQLSLLDSENLPADQQESEEDISGEPSPELLLFLMTLQCDKPRQQTLNG